MYLKELYFLDTVSVIRQEEHFDNCNLNNRICSVFEDLHAHAASFALEVERALIKQRKWS